MTTIAYARIVTAGVALAFLLPITGHAQAEGVQISPAIVEDRVNPGQSYDYSLKVTNVAETARTFFFSVQDITGVDGRGVPIFATEGEVTPYELSSWIDLPEESITMEPGESRTISFRVTVPTEVSPGSHFGGVFLDSQPPRLRTSGAAVGMSVGSIVSLRVAGEVVEEARLRSFSTEKLIYSVPDVDFTANVENLGNVLVRPHGLIKVVNMTGREVASIRVNDSAAAVFPESEREFVVEWDRDEFAIGRYQALISLVYGEDGRRTITGTTSFWVLPVKPILYAIGGVMGFILLVFLIVRVYIRRKLREMGVSNVRRGDYYSKRYDRTASRLLIMTIAIALFSLAFLAFLFLMFA